MPEKTKRESHQEKKYSRQNTLRSYNDTIKDAQGRKAKKMARKNLRRFLGK